MAFNRITEVLTKLPHMDMDFFDTKPFKNLHNRLQKKKIEISFLEFEV
jgi:hypothetical protein